MKRLKNLFCLGIIFLLVANISFAQSQANKLSDEQKEQLAQNIEEFIETLNLTEEQKPAFQAIIKKYAPQMMALRDDNGSKFKKYRKFKSIRKNRNSEMKKLLTKEQYETYLEKQEEMQKRMKEKRG